MNFCLFTGIYPNFDKMHNSTLLLHHLLHYAILKSIIFSRSPSVALAAPAPVGPQKEKENTMGRRSIKENKNIYQLSREAMGLTREQASEKMEYISDDRIEKIESEKVVPHPDEVLTMAECYKNSSLPNYYCSNECPIGMKYVPQLELKDLSQITIEVVNSINILNKEKDRLIEIAVDGKITKDEMEDFAQIREQLDNISASVQTLRMWMEHVEMNAEE